MSSTRLSRAALALPLALLSAAAAAQLPLGGDARPGEPRAALLDSVYGVDPDASGTLQAANPRQRMHATFAADGVSVSSCRAELGLSLVAWGREGALEGVVAVPPSGDGRRVEYRHGSLTEWYVNDPRGLEQGFTIETAPAGEGALRLELALDAGFTAEVLDSGRDAQLIDANGRPAFHYDGLVAFDATGRRLETVLVAGEGRLSIVVLDDGATYPLVVDPWIGTYEANLDTATLEAGDWAGFAVDVDGDRAVVGVPRDEGGFMTPGTASVFVRTGTTWAEEDQVWNIIAFLNTNFGSSVALRGDLLLVGAPDNEGFFAAQQAGTVDMYVRNGSDWTPNGTFQGVDAFGKLGTSVGLSDTSAVLGGPFVVDVGYAYLYDRTANALNQTGFATGTDPDDLFGWSVACDGDYAVIGAPGDDEVGAESGAAFVYLRTGTDWNMQAKFTAGNTAAGDEFGTSVAISGDTLAVGAPKHASNEGSAYVFTRSGTVWTEQAELTAAGTAAGDHFGHSVSVWGDLALVGAPLTNGSANNEGAAYLFERAGTSWSEATTLTAPSRAMGDVFGSSVAGDGDTVAVGAYLKDHIGVDSGTAFAFRLSQPGGNYCTAGTSASGCQAILSTTGTPSATAPSGFTLSAATVEGSKDGLFFFGANGKQANGWGNGTSFQCVTPPVSRAGLLTGTGTNGACDGAFAQDLNALWCPGCPKPAKNPGAGTTVQAQLWYRDPQNTSNQTTSLSDAVEFVVQP